jgi:hypothetical protein
LRRCSPRRAAGVRALWDHLDYDAERIVGGLSLCISTNQGELVVPRSSSDEGVVNGAT